MNTEKSLKQFKVVNEKHSDGYVAYPIGVVGAIVGQGDTYEEALSDVKSAIACYAEVFGKAMLEDTASVASSCRVIQISKVAH